MAKKLLLIVFFLAACAPVGSPLRETQRSLEDSESLPTNPTNPDQPLPNVPPPHDLNGTQACYPKNCVGTVDKQTFAANPDYQYLDPATDPDFPSNFNRDLYRAPARMLDITAWPVTLLLSADFLMQEFLEERKGRFGFIALHLIRTLQKIRDQLQRPVVVNSGYRSPGYNQNTPGAARWSRHQYGDAVDFASEGKSFQELAQICLDHGASFYQIYASHIHCDWRNTPGDVEFYDVSNGPTHTFYRGFSLLKSQLETSAEIKVERQGDGQELTVNSWFEDDMAEASIHWRIHGLSKPGPVETMSYHAVGTTKLQLKLPPGRYEIEASVGGSVTVKKEINVD